MNKDEEHDIITFVQIKKQQLDRFKADVRANVMKGETPARQTLAHWDRMFSLFLQLHME